MTTANKISEWVVRDGYEENTRTGMVRLSNDTAQLLNVPRELELWRLNLGLALCDLPGFVDVLQTLATDDIHDFWRDAGEIIQRSQQDPTPFVPADMADDFREGVRLVRLACISEVASRGENIAAWVEPSTLKN